MSDQLQSLDDTVHVEPHCQKTQLHKTQLHKTQLHKTQRHEALGFEPHDGAVQASEAGDVDRKCDSSQVALCGSVGFEDPASSASQIFNGSLYADDKRYPGGKRDFDGESTNNGLQTRIEPLCDVSTVTNAAFEAIANDVGGRVRLLQIDVIGSELIVAGRVSSYHVKQLVTSAVLSVLRQHTLTNALTVETVR